MSQELRGRSSETTGVGSASTSGTGRRNGSTFAAAEVLAKLGSVRAEGRESGGVAPGSQGSMTPMPHESPEPTALVERMRPYSRTIFGEMSALATRLGAVNLGQGFPDDDGPEVVKQAAIEAIRDGRGNQYPPAHGLPELRRAIASHQKRRYGLELDWQTDVVVATGASGAIAASVLALTEPGDEVVMFDPYFDLYPADIALAGATRVTVPLSGPDLRPDPAALAAAITPRTRLLLLNSPHNPTGIVFTRAELEAVARVACEHDLLVIADEAYEHLWFDDNEHVPIATLPGMWERTVTIGSGGKSFSFTGWKVGWATGPRRLIDAVKVVRQHLSYVSSGPFQWAIAEGLTLPDQYFTEFRTSLAARRDLLATGLANLGMRVLTTQGTYFISTDVTGSPSPDVTGSLSTDVTGPSFNSGSEFCEWIPQHAGVVAIPMSALSDHPQAEPFVRWAFCKEPGTLREAIARLEVALSRRRQARLT